MKYLPYILILVAFALGWLISPGEKVDSEAFKKEREAYQQRISDLQSQIAAQDSIGLAIMKRMTVDSLKYLDALKRKEIAISKLRKDIEKTNYHNYTAASLDSIRAYILRAR